MEHLIGIAQTVSYVLIVIVFMGAAKFLRTIFSTDQLSYSKIEEGSNLALGLRTAGLYLGIAVGMLGALNGESSGFSMDIAFLLFSGILLIALLALSQVINNRIILSGIDNDVAVAERNNAVGFVEFSSYVSTGLIANGTFTGEGGGFQTAIAFFFLGQAALLLTAKTYSFMSPYAGTKQVESGNITAGMMLGGMMIALAFILRSSVMGTFTSWEHDIAAFLIAALYGIIVLMLLNLLIDWIFLPKTTFHQQVERKNVAIISVAICVRIGLALTISQVAI